MTVRMRCRAFVSGGEMVDTCGSETGRVEGVGAPPRTPGPNRPHLSERGSAVSIMLPSGSDVNPESPGWRAYDLTPEMVAPLVERFERYYERRGPDECWIWGGPTLGYTGYPSIGRSSRFATNQHLLAHRVAWVADTGLPLTDQITIDHICVNRLCVNPAHMEPVTLSENLTRRHLRSGAHRSYPALTEDEIRSAREAGRLRVAEWRKAKVESDRAAARESRRRPPRPLLDEAERLRRKRESSLAYYYANRERVMADRRARVQCEECGQETRQDKLRTHRKRLHGAA